jgi:iron(III) transport system permease protein
MLAFVSALKDLPTAVLLRPPGFDTLPVRIWAAASESVYTQAAPAALLLLLCAVVPMILLTTTDAGRRTAEI